MYQLKLLQLVDVIEFDGEYHLQVRIQADTSATYYWKVDRETALSLQAVTDFTKGYLYRLSFKTLGNRGTITETYLSQSQRFDFVVSKEFSQQLGILKDTDEVDKLDELTFLSKDLVSKSVETYTIKVEKPEKVAEEKPARPKKKFSAALVTASIAIAAIVFTYTGHTIYTEAQAGADRETPVLQEQKPEIPAPATEVVVEKPESTLLEDNITVEELPEVPFYELADGTSYNLPEGMVALTFDDGPSKYSAEIVDILKQYGVGGTFFLVGSNLNKYPEHVEYIYENGYAIGSHSMTHVDFSVSTLATQEDELFQFEDVLGSIITEEITLFRPPFGKLNETTELIMQELGQKIVLWNNDPKDWEIRNASKIIQHIKSTDVSGSIILLHETKSTVDALPAIISYLQEQDLEIVSLR